MFNRKTIEVPIDLINVNKNQPRKYFDEEQLLELRDSIKEYGILQPLIIRKEDNGRYLLIAGERRLRAAKMAELKSVPAVIKSVDDRDLGLIALVENIQRENLGFIEEAKAYRQLMVKYDITQAVLADKLGKKQSTISNKLRILNLPDDIQNTIVKYNLTERHARALLKINNDSERRIIIDKVIKHGFNVKQTDKLVEEYIAGRKRLEKDRQKVRHISYKLYLNTFKKSFNDMGLQQKGALFEHKEDENDIYITIKIPKGIEGINSLVL